MRSIPNRKNKRPVKSSSIYGPDGGVDIQRYDTMKYRQFDKLTDKQLGFSGDQKKLIF